LRAIGRLSTPYGIRTQRALGKLKSISFPFAEQAKNSENEALRFAPRNETFRDKGHKSLRSLRVLNQRFRGIVCFQWFDPRFVSRRSRMVFFNQNVASKMLSSDPTTITRTSEI
jgi:hypothetical protein